jgi:hypothetical protein
MRIYKTEFRSLDLVLSFETEKIQSVNDTDRSILRNNHFTEDFIAAIIFREVHGMRPTYQK